MVKALEAISGSDALVKVSPSLALFQLTHLSLVSNYQLTDVTALQKLSQLHALVVPLNKLTDVKGLEKLTRLKELDLEDNPDLTKAQIDQLQKALPKCSIRSNPKN